jgi:medium-chain acyl-[acyl-carrier-protein] hydrolase
MLPPQIELCALLPPGRERRMHEPPFEHIDSLIESLGKAIEPFLDRPIALFGHSMGALISFELAHHLKRRLRAQPIHLFASGMSAPQLPRKQLYHLPEDEFVCELRKLNGMPKEILDNPELMSVLLPRLRADFKLCDTYAYSARDPLDCPITALGGIDDSDVPQSDLLAWRSMTRGRFEMQRFPGDHFFIESARESLLALLSTELSRYLQ